MSPLPNVKITQSNGNLGILPQSEDSISGIVVSGVAVAGKFALGDLQGPFTSIEEVQAVGIDAAYDATNTTLAFKHINDFFSIAPRGTKLYVMVAAKTVLLSTICDKASVWVKKMLDQATQGRPRIVIVTRVPDGAYTPTYATQLEVDINTAIANAQALVADFQSQYIYPRVIIEAMNWQGDVAATRNLRASGSTPAANRVAVVLGNDNTFVNTLAVNDVRKKYAYAGLVGGKLASVPVHRNIGRTLDGPTAIITAGFSNGAAFNSLTQAQLDTLSDKGFIFTRSFEGQAGFYFNYDHTAAVETDDYNNLRYGRVIDKASLLAYVTYTQRLNDEILVDETTGKMQPSVIKSLEGEVEKSIRLNMGESISSVDAYIDADQNILSTNTINVELSIVPKGNASTFKVTLVLKNPFNA